MDTATNIFSTESSNAKNSFGNTLLGDYLAEIEESRRYAQGRGHSRTKSLIFRGQEEFYDGISPGIYRKDTLLYRFESRMNHLLTSRMSEEFTSCSSDFEKLIKMQHYRFPTRLVDFTLNPLVALYFACQNRKDDIGEEKDGIVFVQAEKLESPKSRSVAIICERAFVLASKKDFILEWDTPNLATLAFASAKDGMGDTSSIKSEIEKGGGIENYLRESVVVQPYWNNERIRRQQGVFMLYGIYPAREIPTFNWDGYPEQTLGDNSLKARIVIPNKHKAELLEQLDAIGINGAFLFPELEGQARHIKETFEKLAKSYNTDFIEDILSAYVERNPDKLPVEIREAEGYVPFEEPQTKKQDTGKQEPTTKQIDTTAETNVPHIKMKVMEEVAAAGAGSYLNSDDTYNVLLFPVSEVSRKADFGVRISGNSMEPRYPDGCTVWVECCLQINEHEDGVFVYEGKSYCKQLTVDKEKRRVVLKSINRECSDVTISANDIDTLHTVGRVLGRTLLRGM